VQLTLPPASDTVYFCAANSTGVLRYVTDPSQCTSTESLVTVNRAPVANDVTATTNEDNSVTITLSGIDADGDILIFAITDLPDNGVLGPIITTGPTTATVNYTPNLNYNGPDSFTYKASDDKGAEDTATISITVSPVNDAPTFTEGGAVTVNEDSEPYSATWATSISAGPADEAGQTVTFTVMNDNNGLFSVQPAISSGGVLTFTPAPDAFGTANVTVYAQDNGGTFNGGIDTTATQTFTIMVSAVDD
jgi:large repetitive protein